MLKNDPLLGLTGRVESQIYIYFYLGCVMLSKGNTWVVTLISRPFLCYDPAYLKDFLKYTILNFVLNQD